MQFFSTLCILNKYLWIKQFQVPNFKEGLFVSIRIPFWNYNLYFWKRSRIVIKISNFMWESEPANEQY